MTGNTAYRNAALPSRGGQPMQAQAECEREYGTEDERRECDRRRREGGDGMIERAAATDGCQETERHAHAKRQQQRRKAE